MAILLFCPTGGTAWRSNGWSSWLGEQSEDPAERAGSPPAMSKVPFNLVMRRRFSSTPHPSVRERRGGNRTSRTPREGPAGGVRVRGLLGAFDGRRRRRGGRGRHRGRGRRR